MFVLPEVVLGRVVFVGYIRCMFKFFSLISLTPPLPPLSSPYPTPLRRTLQSTHRDLTLTPIDSFSFVALNLFLAYTRRLQSREIISPPGIVASFERWSVCWVTCGLHALDFRCGTWLRCPDGRMEPLHSDLNAIKVVE